MVGRLILKFLPWWMFALIAASFAPLSASMVQNTLTARAEAEMARVASPPDLIPIAQLTRGRVTAPLNEVHLSGRSLGASGIWERHQKGVNFSYLIVAQAAPPQDSKTRYVLLTFPSYKTDLILDRLAAQTNSDGVVALNGFRSSRTSGGPPRDWLRSALPNGTLVMVIDPYFGERVAAIDEVSGDSMMVSAIAIGMNLLFALVAAVKFRRWRKRRAGKVAHAAPPAPMRRKRTPTKGPSDTGKRSFGPKPKSDGFDNSPIQSAPKGWFGR